MKKVASRNKFIIKRTGQAYQLYFLSSVGPVNHNCKMQIIIFENGYVYRVIAVEGIQFNPQ